MLHGVPVALNNLGVLASKEDRLEEARLQLDSASGVDPHISLAAARQQLPLVELERLLRQHREGPFGLQAIWPVVNVLGFNLALDALGADPAGRPTAR